MHKRVLITGGAGFIGSHLCDFLIAKGYSVVCMDNLITGSMSNIKHLKRHKRFTFIRHNVTEYITLKTTVDYVLHFASPASPVDYEKYPIQTLKVGSLGTHNALGVAKAHKAVFCLASTSEVYGDPLVNPQAEDYWGNVNQLGPRGVYDEAKRFAEAITMAYHRVHGVNVRIARIFNTYGPRMRKNDGRAVPNFITQALAGKPITVYGTGAQTRSFCYISDMIRGLYALMTSRVTGPVNIGNPTEVTVADVARIIVTLTDSPSTIIRKTLPQDDPKVRCPDISRARRLLRFKPAVGLESGLAQTISWFQKKGE